MIKKIFRRIWHGVFLHPVTGQPGGAYCSCGDGPWYSLWEDPPSPSTQALLDSATSISG